MKPSDLIKGQAQGGERARAVAPTLVASSREDDERGALAASTVSALRLSGLLAMALPARYGGPELSPIDAVAEIETLAISNASAAWYAAVSSTGSTAAWFLDEATVRHIWSRGTATLLGGSGQVGGLADVAGDGIRVRSGEWRWGSGVRDADWMQVGLTLDTGETVTAFLSRDGGFTSNEDWNALGLRASSSGTFRAVPDHVVPELLVVRRAPGEIRKARIDGTLGRFSGVSYNSALFAAIAVGNALGALDEFAQIAAGKTAVTASTPLAGSPDTWRHFGEALVLVAQARSALRATVIDLTAQAEAGSALAPEGQALSRACFAAAADRSTRAIQLCFDLAGSSAVERAGSLERRLRDALVINQHYYLSKRAPSLLGKIHFDQELTDFEYSYLRR